ncbi:MULTISPECIES: entericidin A/B family lipoprotein [unclassified Herbaspirillum]|nr:MULTISPECIES: entericidin A/B family lipoprotein [unclassified Herbaspirillum]MBB5391916.1 putative small secreted protein [Herbaspirillum sp. SJZ102]TQK13376.1 putative small secreted protein [Herbaspirillum sp. SJZ130]TQK15380.1 putative small secreted protein [Herbaspirillum sp. SJZ106]TWC71275.1 putative small secreted protein [Herbaspirillum sp. SJZ099]
MRKISALFLLFAALGSLAGCNTVDGFGKDVQTVGEKMQDASKK